MILRSSTADPNQGARSNTHPRGADRGALLYDAHRSVLVVESVRLGHYHIGLSTDLPAAKDLIHDPLIEEPLVLIFAGLGRDPGQRRVRDQPLISIEAGSATWNAIEPQIRKLHPQLLQRQLIPVETFSATVQMVKAGFGDGLVPLGMAIEMKLDRYHYREIRGVTRNIALITRKTTNHLAGFQLLRAQLVKEAARVLFPDNGAGDAGSRRKRS